ncbi:MAG: hypothetical protein JWQ97_241, partial [Phenylobacterium sp.]|nr:hypothetical protein [Phenylobacterium sp.]
MAVAMPATAAVAVIATAAMVAVTVTTAAGLTLALPLAMPLAAPAGVLSLVFRGLCEGALAPAVLAAAPVAAAVTAAALLPFGPGERLGRPRVETRAPRLARIVGASAAPAGLRLVIISL